MLAPDHRSPELVNDDFVFHHVGVAVQDIHTALPVFQNLFRYKLISGPFDDPIQNVSVCFLSRGERDTVIELVAPLGPGSPVAGVLKKGQSIYHICYEVPNIRTAIDHLSDRGCFLLSGPDPAVAFQKREIAWLMTETNLLIELVQKQEGKISGTL